MDWPVLVLGKIIAGNLIASWVFRTLGRSHLPLPVPTAVHMRRVNAQQIITFACGGIYLAFSGLSLGSSEYLQAIPIFLVGIIGSSGLYLTMRAKAISLSRSTAFETLSAIIPITLSATLLGEWVAFRSGLLLSGFALTALGVTLYFIYDIRAKIEKDVSSVPMVFYGYGTAFMLSAGITSFLMNAWAKSSVSAPLFISAWYTGTLVGGGILLLLVRAWQKGKEEIAAASLFSPSKERLLVIAAGLSVFANMWFLFSSFQQVPLLVVAPFYVTADIVGPLLVGMFFFGEWKVLQKWGYLFFGMDLVGTCIVALSRVLSP